MTNPLMRYALDPTGLNPNNLVIGEVHTLAAVQTRAIAPLYGPFFSDTIVVYDHGNSVLLTKNLDYHCVHLLQDASLTFGKEVCQMILITNKAVSDQVRLNYQVLGGYYQNSSQAVVDVYNTFLNDRRPVDWEKGILNKPLTYTPSSHMHLLEDVVGFGPLVVALERIGQAVTLSNIPAYQALVDWVVAFNKSFATEQEILDLQSTSEKMVSLDGLKLAAQKWNFNAITFRPNARKVRLGSTVTFSLSCTNFIPNEQLYWEVVNGSGVDGTEDSMFVSKTGMVPIINQVASFIVSSKRGSKSYGNRKFHVRLRRNSQTGPILAEYFDVMLVNKDPRLDNTYLTLNGGLWEHVCCLSEPGMTPSAEACYLVRESTFV